MRNAHLSCDGAVFGTRATGLEIQILQLILQLSQLPLQLLDFRPTVVEVRSLPVQLLQLIVDLGLVSTHASLVGDLPLHGREILPQLIVLLTDVLNIPVIALLRVFVGLVVSLSITLCKPERRRA